MAKWKVSRTPGWGSLLEPQAPRSGLKPNYGIPHDLQVGICLDGNSYRNGDYFVCQLGGHSMKPPVRTELDSCHYGILCVGSDCKKFLYVGEYMNEFEGTALEIAKWPVLLTCPVCGTEHSYLESDLVYSTDPYTYKPL